ncbi:MAG: efflux transporter periplasmic adaptor subunit, partial [Gemmatimonadetes bacterium]|nr:efflux transporter periplasmic adaptor subunit [Gemmatimonadota bacterium]
RTRTLRAHADFDNSGGMLRAHMFASASVSVRDRRPSLVVPAASVQWEGCCNVVFIKKSATEYQPRKVHLGIATGTVYEVLGGLDAGDEVVTQGSFLLKTEILKGSIGAGCCEIDPGA